MNCGKSLERIPPATSETHLSKLQRSAPEGLQEKIRATSSDIEGERKPVTILFSDIVDSTSIAEKLDPEEWREIVSGAHRRVSEAIYRYEGTIAQLLGDGVLAFFGAPITHEDDPERAVRAALDIQESIQDYVHELQGLLESFRMRIGINTGEVVIGNIGTDMHMEYLAIGDAVNIAARLQGEAEPNQVLISGTCAKFVEHAFHIGGYRSIEVKGKSDPIEVAVVKGIKQDPGLARGLGGVRTPFIGRTEESVQLQEALLTLRQGQGQIIAISGDAGIGKTRLLEHSRESISKAEREEAETHFASSTFRWIEGRALSYGGSLSFWTINQLLLDDLGLSDGSPQLRIKAALHKRLRDLFEEEKAHRIMPFLSHLLGLSLEDGDKELIARIGGESLKMQTSLYLTDYFEKVVKIAPTIVVLEDLHWSDPSSLDMLTHLFPLSDKVPLTFVLLMRIDPDHGSWDLLSIARKQFPHRFTEISLRRLGNRESKRLVEELLRPDVIPGKVRELILKRAEGNPFYLEEVVRHLLESGLIIEDGGKWIVSDQIEVIGLPETLQGVLLARIDRLEGEIRNTLQMASVIGKSFLFKLLEAISEAEIQLEGHLTQLQRADIVREKTRLPDLEYVFKHSLTQEAAYDSLLIERKKAFHLKVAEAIEELFSDRIDEFLGLLAHHFSASNALEKAGDYLWRAGYKASVDGALEEAIEFLTKAKATYAQLENQAMMCRLQIWLGYTYWALGDRKKSLKYLHNALTILETAEESSELAEVLGHISRMHMMASEYDQAIEWGERALELTKRLDMQEMTAHALNNIGSALCGKGDMENGLSKLTESLHIALELDMKAPVTRAYHNRSEQLFAIGRYEEAIADYHAYYKYGLRKNDEFNQAWALLQIAAIDWILGRWGNAIGPILKIKDEMVGIWKVWAYSQVGRMYNDLGLSEVALVELESLLAVAIRAEEIQTSVPYMGEVARAYAAVGRDTEATRVIDQYIALIDDISFFDDASISPLLFSCRWFATQEKIASLEKCEASVERLERLHAQLPFPEALASLEEGKGTLSMATGNHSDAVMHFRNAMEIWNSLGRLYDQARALREHGRASVAVDDTLLPKVSYEKAVEIIDSLASQLAEDEIRQAFLASDLAQNIHREIAALK
jgi:predicted ATPase/class 3 adenylate cyclase